MLGITTENSKNQTFLRSLVLPRTDCVEATFIGKMKDVDIEKAVKTIYLLMADSNFNVILNFTKFDAEPAEKSYLASEIKKKLMEREQRVTLFLLVKPNMINNIYMKDLQELHNIKVYNSGIQLKLDLQEQRISFKRL